ncbi:hypothetical protein UFOVP1221_11 [uncultured Caudovirales phage]|uniref:Uncharacterized protein n=1 Tax=uncultured Caudovirales phage TaxID=2100421 RepID=A0A6J5MP61_9CAUD|nr:hypothetical protein UFOVP491_3 [uncultured Caudovirales phage]CAB4191162.1 hypothetical protein UFOVP1221_11 [uncultured Caudovirales phage]
MANPTSNFGWQMPTSTDLVTDLPADFETFGQAVDTSLADLKGGTSGQVLKKNSNTDMDFVWSSDSVGMTNPMTTTGDTIYSSSGSTPARLGIGSTGQILTVSGGVPTWATPAGGGGLTLLSTTTFNNSVTNYTVGSISGSYKNLLIVGTGLQDASSAGSIGVLNWQFNGDTGSNYSWTQIRNNNGTIGSNGANAYTNIETGLTFAATTDSSIRFGNFQFMIYNYASTSLVKAVNSQGGCGHNNGLYTNTLSGQWNNSADAITSIKFTNAQGTNLKAGTIQIYGVA